MVLCPDKNLALERSSMKQWVQGFILVFVKGFRAIQKKSNLRDRYARLFRTLSEKINA